MTPPWRATLHFEHQKIPRLGVQRAGPEVSRDWCNRRSRPTHLLASQLQLATLSGHAHNYLLSEWLLTGRHDLWLSDAGRNPQGAVEGCASKLTVSTQYRLGHLTSARFCSSANGHSELQWYHVANLAGGFQLHCGRQRSTDPTHCWGVGPQRFSKHTLVSVKVFWMEECSPVSSVQSQRSISTDQRSGQVTLCVRQCEHSVPLTHTFTWILGVKSHLMGAPKPSSHIKEVFPTAANFD